MQTVAAANALRGGLIALPISRKPASRRPRTLLIAGEQLYKNYKIRLMS